MDQLKLLMEYTKFHIGMYTTLCTVLISILGLEIFKARAVTFQPYLFVTLAFFVLAGAFGGLVGSSIPLFKDFDEFKKARLGPWRWEWIPAPWCAHLEHTFFWLGILVVLLGLWNVR